jgi:hypothetical protein
VPNPTPGAVHVDVLLTDLSVAFLQSSTKYVADRAFPRVPVAKRSDIYAVYSQADFLRDEVAPRGPGAAPVRIGYNTDNTNKYYALEFAAEHIIDDQVRANASGPYMPEEDAVKFLTQKMLIKREVFATLADKVPSYINDVTDLSGTIKQDEIKEYFATSIEEGTQRLLSEDYHFCNIWRKAGGKVWAAPWAQLAHIGTYAFEGQLLQSA